MGVSDCSAGWSIRRGFSGRRGVGRSRRFSRGRSRGNGGGWSYGPGGRRSRGRFGRRGKRGDRPDPASMGGGRHHSMGLPQLVNRHDRQSVQVGVLPGGAQIIVWNTPISVPTYKPDAGKLGSNTALSAGMSGKPPTDVSPARARVGGKEHMPTAAGEARGRDYNLLFVQRRHRHGSKRPSAHPGRGDLAEGGRGWRDHSWSSTRADPWLHRNW